MRRPPLPTTLRVLPPFALFPNRAGTEYGSSWMGFYEGAIQTAEDAATKLGGLLGAKGAAA